MTLVIATAAGRPKLDVVVYHAGECGSWRSALATAKAAVRELRLDATVRVVPVANVEEAKRLKFRGSPSVTVNGVDVEGPPPRERPAGMG